MAHANISVNTMLPWLYLLVFVCLEVALFLLYTDSDIDTSQYLWVRIHSTSISAMAGVCWARLAASDEDRRDRLVMVAHLAAWTILVGPFGVAIAAMFLIPSTVNDTHRTAVPPAPAAEADYVEISKAELLHGALLDGRHIALGNKTQRVQFFERRAFQDYVQYWANLVRLCCP